MKKTNKILEAKPEIIIIVIVLILIVLAFIQPIHVFITKNTIKKKSKKYFKRYRLYRLPNRW